MEGKKHKSKEAVTEEMSKAMALLVLNQLLTRDRNGIEKLIGHAIPMITHGYNDPKFFRERGLAGIGVRDDREGAAVGWRGGGHRRGRLAGAAASVEGQRAKVKFPDPARSSRWQSRRLRRVAARAAARHSAGRGKRSSP